MAASLSPLPPSLFLGSRSWRSWSRRSDAILVSESFYSRSLESRRASFLGSIVSRTRLHASWIDAEGNADDDNVGGWSVVEDAPTERKKGSMNVLIMSLGTSAVILVAAFAACKLSGMKFCFNIPMHAFNGVVSKFEPDATADSNAYEASSVDNADTVHSGTEKKESNPDPRGKTDLRERLQRVIIPSVVDSTQQEALLVLKKLKIIEDDVDGTALCTRREYARWLVKVNYFLERNLKHQLAPFLLASGSSVSAFTDVSVSDPDFWCIEALAEAGIVSSMLTNKNYCSECEAKFEFSPESYISRIDLVSWKVQLEHSVTEGNEKKTSSKKICYVDLRSMDLDACSELLSDTMAGDKSIISRVFGCTRRLQPHLPATVAQAAVALTSGRMVDAIYSELSRLESEKLARQIEINSIRAELLNREEISKFWEEKLSDAKAHGLVVHENLLAVRSNFENEMIVQHQMQAEFLKAKASLDCENQLLQNLKEEVNEMCKRLICERANVEAELRNLDELQDWLSKLQAVVKAKSILEAEKESVRMLRTWVEDEAKQIQARAKVLEDAALRWKWNILQGTTSPTMFNVSPVINLSIGGKFISSFVVEFCNLV